MKRNTSKSLKAWKMRMKYDFSHTRSNKYAKKYAEGTNIVVIEPDLIEFFPDSDRVNTAFRTLVSIFSKLRSKRKSKRDMENKHN